jgi:hypothetical protein
MDPDNVPSVIGRDLPSDGRSRWAYELPTIDTPDDIRELQRIEGTIRWMTASRKSENARFIEVEKAWKRHKDALHDRIVQVIRLSGGKVKTMLGTSYTVTKNRPSVKIEDEKAVIRWLIDEARGTATAIPGLLEYEPRLSEKGKDHVRDLALSTGELIPGVSITPARVSYATRLSLDPASQTAGLLSYDDNNESNESEEGNEHRTASAED